MSRPTDEKPPAPALLLEDIIVERVSRRSMVVGVLGLPLVACAGRLAGRPGSEADARLGFASISISTEDAVRLPPGYQYPGGQRLGRSDHGRAPPPSAPTPARAPPMQAHAGGHVPRRHGLLPAARGRRSRPTTACSASTSNTPTTTCCTPEGMEPWTAEKVQKSKNAHGLGVYRGAARGRPLAHGRRLALRPADHRRHAHRAVAAPPPATPRMRTAAGPGRRTRARHVQQLRLRPAPPGAPTWPARRTSPPTSSTTRARVTRLADRYGVPTTNDSWGFRWHEFDERFDAGRHPNEPNRFGWVVEIDPYDPGARAGQAHRPGPHGPRGRHRSPSPRDGRVVYYMGDDDFRSKFEHIYKFVSRRPYVRDGGPAANRDLLDEGTLLRGPLRRRRHAASGSPLRAGRRAASPPAAASPRRPRC